MNWNSSYGLRSYLKSSLWVVPFIAIPLELIATRLVHGLDAWLGWSLLDYSVSGAQALLQAFVTATLSRLRAMIENLVQTLPAHRHAALLQQLGLLDRDIEKNFTYPEDLALAHIADAQGLGGHSGKIER